MSTLVNMIVEGKVTKGYLHNKNHNVLLLSPFTYEMSVHQALSRSHMLPSA